MALWQLEFARVPSLNKQTDKHANNFPQHRFADVFDDVIEDVLASGVIGDKADGCRGAVDV